MRERKGELSVLNVILALLVIFIHISSNPVSVLDKTQLPYMIVLTLWRLSQFVVQGFIFLSGLKMFLNKGDDFNYKKFYVSRFKNIVIPYILWVIIYYVYFWHHGYFLPDQNHASELAKYVLKGNLVSHFYFVVTIVQFYALAPVWVFVARKTKPVLSIAASLVITVIFAMFLPEMIAHFNTGYYFEYNDRVFTTYLFYFVLCIFAGANYEKFKQIITGHFVPISIAFLICAALNTYFSYINFAQIKTITYLEYIHIAYCISAVLFFFALSLKIKNAYRLRIVQKIDGASYYIYLMHCLFIFIIDAKMAEYGITSVKYTYPIRAAFVYVCSVGIAVIYKQIKTKLTKKEVKNEQQKNNSRSCVL